MYYFNYLFQLLVSLCYRWGKLIYKNLKWLAQDNQLFLASISSSLNWGLSRKQQAQCPAQTEYMLPLTVLPIIPSFSFGILFKAEVTYWFCSIELNFQYVLLFFIHASLSFCGLSIFTYKIANPVERKGVSFGLKQLTLFWLIILTMYIHIHIYMCFYIFHNSNCRFFPLFSDFQPWLLSQHLLSYLSYNLTKKEKASGKNLLMLSTRPMNSLALYPSSPFPVS